MFHSVTRIARGYEIKINRIRMRRGRAISFLFWKCSSRRDRLPLFSAPAFFPLSYSHSHHLGDTASRFNLSLHLLFDAIPWGDIIHCAHVSHTLSICTRRIVYMCINLYITRAENIVADTSKRIALQQSNWEGFLAPLERSTFMTSWGSQCSG